MVGGRVGRYLRVGIYTAFGHFFPPTYYIPIKSACILTHLRASSIHFLTQYQYPPPPSVVLQRFRLDIIPISALRAVRLAG